MSKLDRFGEDYKKLETLERQLKEHLKERALNAKNGQSTAKVDYLLRSQSDNIKDDLKNFDKLAFMYQHEGSKFPELSESEKQKRIKKIEDLKVRIEDVQSTIRLTLDGDTAQNSMGGTAVNSGGNKQYGYQVDLESRPLVKGEDGEYEDTRGKDNRQVLQHQKKMIKNQDEHLDEIAGIVQNIKYENQNFAVEVGYQNKMLGDINVQVDRTHQKMVKVDNKLKELIAKSNQWCLWIIIIAELVILILLLVL
eukprot:403341037